MIAFGKISAVAAREVPLMVAVKPGLSPASPVYQYIPTRQSLSNLPFEWLTKNDQALSLVDWMCIPWTKMSSCIRTSSVVAEDNQRSNVASLSLSLLTVAFEPNALSRIFSKIQFLIGLPAHVLSLASSSCPLGGKLEISHKSKDSALAKNAIKFSRKIHRSQRKR